MGRLRDGAHHDGGGRDDDDYGEEQEYEKGEYSGDENEDEDLAWSDDEDLVEEYSRLKGRDGAPLPYPTDEWYQSKQLEYQYLHHESAEDQVGALIHSCIHRRSRHEAAEDQAGPFTDACIHRWGRAADFDSRLWAAQYRILGRHLDLVTRTKIKPMRCAAKPRLQTAEQQIPSPRRNLINAKPRLFRLRASLISGRRSMGSSGNPGRHLGGSPGVDSSIISRPARWLTTCRTGERHAATA